MLYEARELPKLIQLAHQNCDFIHIDLKSNKQTKKSYFIKMCYDTNLTNSLLRTSSKAFG